MTLQEAAEKFPIGAIVKVDRKEYVVIEADVNDREYITSPFGSAFYVSEVPITYIAVGRLDTHEFVNGYSPDNLTIVSLPEENNLDEGFSLADYIIEVLNSDDIQSDELLKIQLAAFESRNRQYMNRKGH